ncbi:MAG: hypothetical protein AAFN10_10910 [Bacteroidota bacterium]
MSDRSQMLYLLHAERRLLDQVYKKRNHSLGLSWEAALPWVQDDPDRIHRLLSQKILKSEADNLRLSSIIQSFWEQWEAETVSLYSWAELEADWQSFTEEILQSERLPSSANLQYWVKQLQVWQRFLLSLSMTDLSSAQLDWLQAVANQIRAFTSQRLGLDQSLDRQLVMFLERLQELGQRQKSQPAKGELLLQIARLQELRQKDLLFEQSNISEQLQLLEATLWNDKASPALWPSLGTKP